MRIERQPKAEGTAKRATKPWLVCALALLTGCGFHLRSSIMLPADVKAVHVQAPNPELAEEIKLLLEDSGAAVASTEQAADLTLAVEPERFERRLLAVDPTTGKAREFELTYTTAFSLRGKGGQTLMEPQRVDLSRDIVFDPEAVIGTSREEELIHTEMRHDAARQILWRVQARLNP